MTLRSLFLFAIAAALLPGIEAQAARRQSDSAHAQPRHGAFRLASIITDSMVVQQKSKLPLWGWGRAGEKVSIEASWGARAASTVQSDGAWNAVIRTPKAGGPFTMTITSTETSFVLKNILAGEVWLASGQSNMEMPLEGWPPSDTLQNSAAEIRHARNPLIRMFTVGRALSLTPDWTAAGVWLSASPETAGSFSATAYFFARALQRALHVPIGIIHASWSGSPIEPWLSARAISAFKEYQATMQTLSLRMEERKKYEAWLKTFPAIDMSARRGDLRWAGLDFRDEECSLPGYNDSLWKEMKLPQNWEQTEMGDFDGAIWFRRTVQVPPSWVNKPITLELGPIDDMDRTFVNGKLVGAMETDGMWNTDRIYPLPDSLVGATRVFVAVRVVDTQGGGGIYGSESRMRLRLTGTNETVPLAGAWKYLPVAAYDGNTFHVFGEKDRPYYTHPSAGVALSIYTPTALYNGMIAPIAPFTIKGAIWYQGESNVQNHEAYRALLPAMIDDWRSAFRCGAFPFYYVQIAPYGGYSPDMHSELLREAQLEALSTKNTGMAVTLDIGSVRTIHPSNKQDVGERLARWALAKNYGKAVAFSGPIYKGMKRERGAIVLSFDHAGRRLMLKGGSASAEFQIAGADKRFTPAKVRVRGRELVLSHPGLKDPVAVRYAFTDTASAVLFNAEGLPSPSFRTDHWQ